MDLLTASHHFLRSRISHIATSDQPVRLGSMPAPDSFALAPSIQLDCHQLLSMHSIMLVWEANIFLQAAALRPYTWGKRFLLFCPDSHSAYYDSFVSALGRSLPPPTGSFKDLLYLKKNKFLAEKAVGRPTHACNTCSGNECGIPRLGRSN